MGVHWNIRFVGGVQEEPIYGGMGGGLPKKGACTACIFKWGWCFWGGRLIPQCTLC